MNTATRTIGAASAVVLTAGAVTIAATVPAHADIDRHGRHAGASYEFSVDREDGGFEVSFDLDRAKPGSRWVIAMSHDGKRFFKKTLTARADDDDPRDGEFDVERWRPNTAGKDTFRVSIRKAGSDAKKVVTIRTR